jgi:putative endonuclease
MTPRVLVRLLIEALKPAPADYRGLRGAGQRWERLAERRLVEQGYTIRDRNFRATAGEIDFVGEEGGVLCFIEVKGRRGTAYGLPGESVTGEKQARIIRAAEEYLHRKRIGAVPCRYDVVSILESDGGTEVAILRDAFRGPASARLRR